MTVYSAEQIKIPPTLPSILKDYAKHIIKTNPTDLLAASAEYFTKELAKQQHKITGRLTLQQLQLFYGKFSRRHTVVSLKEIKEACLYSDIEIAQFKDTIQMGKWTGDEIPWMCFFALLCASSAGSMKDALILASNVGSEDGETDCGFVFTVIDFLATEDKTVSAHIVNALKSAVPDNLGQGLSTETLIETINECFAMEEPAATEPEPVVETAAAGSGLIDSMEKAESSGSNAEPAVEQMTEQPEDAVLEEEPVAEEIQQLDMEKE